MRKGLFWIALLLGLSFSIATVVTVLSHTVQLLDRITLGAIPALLVGVVLDFVTNPAGWLGVILLVVARIFRKKQNVACDGPGKK
ncbi:MAG: hypothetical protein FD131_4425 [Rhodocyclaceae bacterium]|nr:MAG: hypothetical protein FD131_4425 [Rhodocyclaceae bacterium]